MTSKLVRMITRKSKNVVAKEPDFLAYPPPEGLFSAESKLSGRLQEDDEQNEVVPENDVGEEIEDDPLSETHPLVRPLEVGHPLPERYPSINLSGSQSALTERHSSI